MAPTNCITKGNMLQLCPKEDEVILENSMESREHVCILDNVMENAINSYLQREDDLDMENAIKTYLQIEDDLENVGLELELNHVQCQGYLTRPSLPLASRQIACSPSRCEQHSLEKMPLRSTGSMCIDCVSKTPLRSQSQSVQYEVRRAGTKIVKNRGMSDVLPFGEQHDLQHRSISRAIQPGDVLFVRSSGALASLAQIGSTGGVAGHTMLVIRSPTLVTRNSPESFKFREVWPEGASEIWIVRTLECTRGHEGLLTADILMRVEASSGEFRILGEIVTSDGTWELSEIEDEVFEIWQSPASIRRLIDLEIVNSVVEDMQKHKTNWSLSTCMRAIFRTARIQNDVDRMSLFREVCDCWNADPICTSVVIIFWQRCLCKFGSVPTDQGAAIGDGDALDLILRWIPLKADRGLPGELLQTLQQCGWIRIRKMADLQHFSL